MGVWKSNIDIDTDMWIEILQDCNLMNDEVLSVFLTLSLFPDNRAKTLKLVKEMDAKS